ncbi:MAG: DUF4826 family protein [Firmicutes bacterium]|nr:DUF4826 family protein [Gammaproteobacteria bacterium]MCL5051077.1 DUF4826 family protein [Bacillota bacterium]
MSNEQEQAQANAEQATWVREHFQKANGYLVEKGLLTDKVLTKECRYLIPHLAIWKFTLRGSTDKVWAINGVCPSDYVDAGVAETARDALRHFSLRWQLRADNILNDANADETQQKFAQLLINHAEACYDIVEREDLWVDQEF